MKCEDCIEWEYFEGYGYGCYCMQTMTPIEADKCEFYADKRPDVPHSWKPSKIEPQERGDKVNCNKTECYNCVNHNYCDYEAESDKESEE